MTTTAAPSRRSDRAPRSEARRAFTLIELLVVIGVIVILASITLTVGPRVIDARRAAATEQMLVRLDGFLESYIQENGGVPPSGELAFRDFWRQIQAPATNPATSDIEMARTRYGNVANHLPTGETDASQMEPMYPDEDGVFLRPSSAIFVEQIRGSSTFDDLAKLPASRVANLAGANADGDSVQITALLDSWGDPSRPYERHILYVHPDNTRAQQLYGWCVNGRPYFMSAGADGVYGTIQDLPFHERRRMRSNSAPFTTPEAREKFFRERLSDNVYSYPVRPATVSNGAPLHVDPLLER